MKKKVSRSVELAQKAKVYSNTHSGEMLPDASFSKKLIKGNDQIVLGLNPSAQIARECVAGSGLISGLEPVIVDMCKNLYESRDVINVVMLMQLYGLRVSEALQVHSKDVMSNCNILVRGLKGSRDRVVSGLYDREFWLLFMNKNRYLGMDCNRFYIYRLCKKIGHYVKYEGNQKSSVTHSYRHDFCNDAFNRCGDINTVAELVGHKSIKSTEYYVNRKRKKC